DIVIATAAGGARKGYVTRYGGRDLWVVDPAARRCRRFHTGSIDLGAFADADGLPEMDQMALVGSRPFVTLQPPDGDQCFLTADARGFFVTEDDLDGNVTDFVLVSATKAYAIVQARDLRNRLVTFDPSAPTGSVRVLFVRDAFLPDIALAPDGFLWLADESQ